MKQELKKKIKQETLEKPLWYRKLIVDLLKIKLEMWKDFIRRKYEFGKRILKDKEKLNLEYGEKGEWMGELSREVKVSVREIYRCVEAASKYTKPQLEEILSQTTKLTWTRFFEEYLPEWRRPMIEIPLPKGKFSLIYADPPWQYRDEQEYMEFRPHGLGANFHYPSMNLEEIKDIPIEKIANDNCVLFLWGTVPLLPQVFEVLEKWGFEYKTALFWRKKKYLGLGSWFRGQIEVCLVGIKGNVPAFRQQRVNFIDEGPREHSQKPMEMYEIIENLGINPKIELFARNKRDGWTSWGLDILKKIESND